MIPAHCRAARGLLDWKQATLAEAAGLGLSSVVQFERSGRAVSTGTVQAMQRALEAAGVEFTNGDEPGVKLKAKGKRK
jgi:transcriptional regulator with XRE-family HTH domain